MVTRRDFFAAGAAAAMPPSRRLGLYIVLRNSPEAAIAQARDLGFSEIEIYNDNFDPAFAQRLSAALAQHKVTPVSLFSMGPGPMSWNFIDGPHTIGLVPAQYRKQRVQHLIDASEFARKFNIPRVETHCGAIPEDPSTELYREMVQAIREAAQHCKQNGQMFLYHAGQETPVILMRVIEDVGLDNQGIGLDTGNPVMCATGNPADFVEMLAPHMRMVNFKDGVLPTDGRRYGREMPIGKGRVRFRDIMERLRDIHFAGPLLIERENAGPQFAADVRQAKAYLERLMAETGLR